MPPDPFGHLDPWDRQPGESPKAYASFVKYRDLGRGRTVKAAAEAADRAPQYFWKLSHEWGWVERAAAYDREEDRVFIADTAAARLTMARRHARLATALQNKVVAAIQALDPAKLSPSDLIRTLEAATKLERLAWGVPDKLELTGASVSTGAIEEMDEAALHARAEELMRELGSRLPDQEGANR
jgi:hypothetical protein